LRVFVYGYRAAYQHGKTVQSDLIELDFPKSVVVYLRSDEKTPKELTVRLKLPDWSVTEFKIPTRRLSEFSRDELIESSSLIFVPYYPMLFEGEPLKTSGGLEKLKTEAIYIIDRIKEKTVNGEVSVKTAELLINSLEDILENVMIKSKINQKEVEEIMEAVQGKYNLKPLNWRAEGIAIGKADAAREMFAEGFAYDVVQRITKLMPEVLNQLKAEVEASKQNAANAAPEVPRPRRR